MSKKTVLDNRFPGPNSIFRQSLPNGITVLAYENFASRTVAIEGFIRAGALQEDFTKAGLASFTADMLLRGTEQYDFARIYEFLEPCGASLDFGGGRHLTQFSGYCLVEDFDLILELMVHALRAPIFPESQVERMRGQIETGLHIRANDTGRMANLAFMETLYKNHPYGRSIHGYFETIEQIKRDDLVSFHNQHYGPQGMVIGISGAVQSEEIFDKVCNAIGDWSNINQPLHTSVPDMARPSSAIVHVVPMPDKKQVDLVLGLPGPRRSEPDYLHASLMNTILGVFGMMGRIGRSVREEEGLAYHASSHLAGGLGPAPWSVNAGAAPDDVDAVIIGVKREIKRIQRELVPANELDDCKSYRIGSLPVGLETNAAVADTLVDMELYELGLDYLQRFPSLIRDISAQQVQEAAEKYLTDEDLVIVVAGPLPVSISG